MVNSERRGKGLSLASKIIGNDEDELKSDNLYSDEDLTLNSLAWVILGIYI